MITAGVNNRGEGNTGAEASLLSILGRGESATAEIQVGMQKTTMFHLGFLKPLLGRRNTSIGFHLLRNYSQFPWSSYSLLENSVALDIRHQSLENWHHNIRVEGCWRQLGCLQRNTPFDIRLHAGHSLKTALKHILSYSTLDDTQLPKSGFLFRITNEWADLADAKFLKNDIDLKVLYHFVLLFSLRLQLVFSRKLAVCLVGLFITFMFIIDCHNTAVWLDF